MNKKEQLPAQTLADDAGQAFARVAAAHARRRQTRKQLVRGAAAFAAVTLAWFGMHRLKPVAPTVVAALPSYEIISDSELLTQLKGESVLLLKDQGRITDVVFLGPMERKL